MFLRSRKASYLQLITGRSRTRAPEIVRGRHCDVAASVINVVEWLVDTQAQNLWASLTVLVSVGASPPHLFKIFVFYLNAFVK